MYGNLQIAPNSQGQAHLTSLDAAYWGSGSGNSHQAKEYNETCTIKKKRTCWDRGEVLVCFECVGFFVGFCVCFGVFLMQLEGKEEH